jgi:hypothetical protein
VPRAPAWPDGVGKSAEVMSLTPLQDPNMAAENRAMTRVLRKAGRLRANGMGEKKPR